MSEQHSIRLTCQSSAIPYCAIDLPASKSISNRLLILRELYHKQLKIEHLSDALDTRVLQSVLSGAEHEVDIGEAGTAMRFLTAFYALEKGKDVILGGSERMKQRPVAPLVEALNKLGADIRYEEKQGCPPMRIRGKELKGGKVDIDAGISSQFISALLMAGPSMEKGLELELRGDVVSVPYIDLTVALMKQLGMEVKQKGNTYRINPFVEVPGIDEIAAEPDWSAAAFWYELLALSGQGEILLKGLKEDSVQGDRQVAELFKKLGVATAFSDEGALIRKHAVALPESISVSFRDCPDLAQPFLTACAGLGVNAEVKGVKTLHVKETDRVAALKTELHKVGVKMEEKSADELLLVATPSFKSGLTFDTYSDHRMAMALAPMVMKCKTIIVNDPAVVRKSYPGYWDNLQKAGITID